MTGPGRVVVIGGGLVAVRLAEELRQRGARSEIVVVAAEPHAPYDRPPLSKSVLRTEVTEPPYLRKPADVEALDLDLRTGVAAVRLRDADRQVDLDDGTALDYDELVVATGAEPRLLPGVATDAAITLRTYDDAVRLRQELRPGRRLVVVGGGFIGCEVAASARALDVEVTLVEALSGPLVRVLGPAVSDAVAELHLDAGVDLRTGSGVSAIDADTGRVRLTDGTEIDADVVLVALGVRPSTGWLAGSSVEVGDGVLCDATGRTSTPGIWAAGDVSSWWSDRAGRHRRIEHWTTAAEQARTVGANLAGGEPQPLDEVPYFWSDQFDLKLQSLGTPWGDDDVTLFRVGPRERLLAVYGRDGAVTGVVGFGVPKFVMRMRPLLAAAAPYEQALELAQTT